MCTHSWGGLYFVTRVFQGSNSGCQVWWQVTLPTQSSHSAFKSRARGSQGQKYIRDNLFTEAELLVNPFTAPEKCITILRLAFTRANIYSTGWIPLIPNTCNQECFPFQIRFSNICACTHTKYLWDGTWTMYVFMDVGWWLNRYNALGSLLLPVSATCKTRGQEWTCYISYLEDHTFTQGCSAYRYAILEHPGHLGHDSTALCAFQSLNFQPRVFF